MSISTDKAACIIQVDSFYNNNLLISGTIYGLKIRLIIEKIKE